MTTPLPCRSDRQDHGPYESASTERPRPPRTGSPTQQPTHASLPDNRTAKEERERRALQPGGPHTVHDGSNQSVMVEDVVARLKVSQATIRNTYQHGTDTAEGVLPRHPHRRSRGLPQPCPRPAPNGRSRWRMNAENPRRCPSENSGLDDSAEMERPWTPNTGDQPGWTNRLFFGLPLPVSRQRVAVHGRETLWGLEDPNAEVSSAR